jgi:hypothetical protein
MSAGLLEDIEFDRCGQCRGLWFDAFEHEGAQGLAWVGARWTPGRHPCAAVVRSCARVASNA